MRFFNPIYAVARADFLQRIRSYSFFLTVMFAVLLGYGAATGKVSIQLDDYRGVYTSAWVGTMVAMVSTAFISLVGFYIVKNAVDRDRRTGVGQILAATPLSKTQYTFGKFLSNFGVLNSMVLILALGALAMQFFAAEDKQYDFIALLLPSILIAMPMMALTAAVAVLFETLPILRGGTGNVVWFFMFCFSLGLPEVTGKRWLDPTGIVTVGESMMEAARVAIPGYTNGFRLTISNDHAQVAQSLHWQGVHWTAEQLWLRFDWLLFAFFVVLLAAVFFDRFDSTRFAFGRIPGAKAVAPQIQVMQAAGVAPSAVTVHLSPIAANAKRNNFGGLFLAEFWLALKGAPWWWMVVAAGLLVAEFVLPLEVARGPLLGTAWLWPVLVWSTMGTREDRFGTKPLLFSSPRILARQLPACFLAGFAIAVITGAGVAVRLALAGQSQNLVGWIAGAMFLPSMALVLGVVSGTGKAFEAILAVLWYVGSMQHTPGMDYTGAANGAMVLRYAEIYSVLIIGFLAVAFFWRGRQLRSG